MSMKRSSKIAAVEEGTAGPDARSDGAALDVPTLVAIVTRTYTLVFQTWL